MDPKHKHKSAHIPPKSASYSTGLRHPPRNIRGPRTHPVKVKHVIPPLVLKPPSTPSPTPCLKPKPQNKPSQTKNKKETYLGLTLSSIILLRGSLLGTRATGNRFGFGLAPWCSGRYEIAPAIEETHLEQLISGMRTNCMTLSALCGLGGRNGIRYCQNPACRMRNDPSPKLRPQLQLVKSDWSVGFGSWFFRQPFAIYDKCKISCHQLCD